MTYSGRWICAALCFGVGVFGVGCPEDVPEPVTLGLDAGPTGGEGDGQAPVADAPDAPAPDATPPSDNGAVWDGGPAEPDGVTPNADAKETDDLDQPPADDGTPPDDVAIPPTDEGDPPDEGTPPSDEGTPPGDEGTPPGDEGTPPGDEGVLPDDEGTPPGDEGTAPDDEGTPPGDEGTPGDGGSSDAGPTPDLPPADPCLPNPCVNQAACLANDSAAGFACVCLAGWEGALCGTNVDDCVGAPCENGGECVDGIGSFTCTCADGFDGELCDNDIDDCAGEPCQNGGQCIDGVAQFTCECPAGYDGALCANDIDECKGSPCQNGGSCIDAIAGFTCECLPGFSGGQCQDDVDECKDQPCFNGGQCVDAISTFWCQCAAGFSGQLCETDIDECAGGPCLNGGVCTDAINAFSCACAAGFEGDLCADNIDDCQPQPCANGGKCLDGVDGFECECLPGYVGSACQDNVDDCKDQPCLNGGGCIDGVDAFSCVCAAGYTGELCGTDIDDCANGPCLNGGECVDGVASFSCSCPPGFDGDNCGTDLDECAAGPCHNGVCIDLANDFQCNCADGFTGKVCQENIDDCVGEPCLNGGTCIDKITKFSCDCLPGFGGALCETNVDDCADAPCQNGSQCVDGVDGYTCSCQPGWDGVHCNLDIDDCADNPCLNGGQCLDKLNGFSCECAPGFSGALCGDDVDECGQLPGILACQNGGACVDGVGTFTCDCKPGFKGELCDVDCAGCTDGEACTTDVCADDGCDFLPLVCEDGDGCVDNACAAVESCPFGELHNGSCYQAVKKSGSTFSGATATCKALGGALVSITSAEENAHVAALRTATCGTTGAWIGLLDPDLDGEFEWASGEALEYTAWDDGQPSGPTTWAVAMKGTAATWHLQPGFLGKSCLVCEVPAASVGACVSVPKCDDGNPCTTDACDASNGACSSECAVANADAICSDNGGCDYSCVDGFVDADGLAGNGCEKPLVDVDDCKPNPCLNGATCTDLVGTFTCACPPGWEGTLCGTNVDECQDGPCQNGGQCVDGLNAFVCQCPVGFLGDLCETNIDNCVVNPCKNGGACVDGVNAFSCDCPLGWMGALCTQTVCAELVCNDGLFCTIDGCDDAGCNTAPVVCNDQVDCTTEACVEANEGCTSTAHDEQCDDGLACTIDACVLGVGCEVTPDDAPCEDSNPCTTTACNAQAGCETNVTGAICDDANACTTAHCALPAVSPSSCVSLGWGAGGGSTAVCAGLDAAVCPAATSQAGAAQFCTELGARLCTLDEVLAGEVAASSVCDDANFVWTLTPCDGGHFAAQGQASGGVAQSTSCVAAGQGMAQIRCCGDAEPAGVPASCVADGVVACDDGVACTLDWCDAAAGCTTKPDDAACDDDNVCTSEVCVPTQGCVVSVTGATCEDGLACTTSKCAMPEASVLNCNALAWNGAANGDPAVCGGSNVAQGLCAGGASFSDAQALCTTMGARLCTLSELLADEAAGPECDLDAESVWSATACAAGHFVSAGSAAGVANKPIMCQSNGGTARVRCCADAEPTEVVPACVATAGLSCDDSVACTTDYCDAGLGCVSVPMDSACNDNNACTVDSCDANAGCKNVGGSNDPVGSPGNPDNDGDGFGACSGDCCDSVDDCLEPALVNPGAFDVPANLVDDNCDGQVDNDALTCDVGLASNSQSAWHYAQALGICQQTTAAGPGPGYISGALLHPSGQDGESSNGHALRDGFGTVIKNQEGDRLVVLSSGHAADKNDTNPNFASFQGGQNTGKDATAPTDWLAKHGGKFPPAPGCSISSNKNANDGQMLSLTLRAPTNANSFTMKIYFLSAEYPEYVCTVFNDYALVLVDSADTENPADKNIATYTDTNGGVWPLSVNIAKTVAGLFTACNNGPISQCSGSSQTTGCINTNELSGTGFDNNASACGFYGPAGGGTGWLGIQGHVVPGETFTIRMAVWDTADSVWDSMILLDEFTWATQAAVPGLTPGKSN